MDLMVIFLNLILKKRHLVLDALCLKYQIKHNNCEVEGVIPTITGIMGTLQANEVLNSILNLNSKMDKKMIVFNSIKMSFRTINLTRNKNCKNKC